MKNKNPFGWWDADKNNFEGFFVERETLFIISILPYDFYL